MIRIKHNRKAKKDTENNFLNSTLSLRLSVYCEGYNRLGALWFVLFGGTSGQTVFGVRLSHTAKFQSKYEGIFFSSE